MAMLEYRKYLKKLGLSICGHDTVVALGLSGRHLRRIWRGEADVPEPIARLLKALDRQ